MILNEKTIANPLWGYVTTIEMPFSVSVLGSSKINIFDSGQKYDKFTCKCKFEFSKSEQADFYDIYNNLERGQSVKLETEAGFYPFSIAITEPVTGYDVYITDVKNKGMLDDMGKWFGVECTFIWAYPVDSIVWEPLNAEFCKLGNLTFLGYDNIRYSHYKPKQSHSVAVQNTAGGTVYGFNNPNNLESNETKFTLELRDDVALNIIYQIINNFRAEPLAIEGGLNYFIFSLSEGDETAFSAKLKTGKFAIKHKAHNQHDIDFELVKI